MEEDVSEDYKSALVELACNSKPLINMLTMLAEENVQQSEKIVQAIEAHLQKVSVEIKLPVLYLIDSIMKNVGGVYRPLFTQNIVSNFCSVFEKGDERSRMQLYKLRQTWNDLFPNKKLYALDLRVKNIDPAWPILAQPPEQQPQTIHVNPKFLEPKKALTTPAKPVEEAKEVQKLLIAKQQELMILEQQKIQLEKQLQQQLQQQEKEKQKVVAGGPQINTVHNQANKINPPPAQQMIRPAEVALNRNLKSHNIPSIHQPIESAPSSKLDPRIARDPRIQRSLGFGNLPETTKSVSSMPAIGGQTFPPKTTSTQAEASSSQPSASTISKSLKKLPEENRTENKASNKGASSKVFSKDKSASDFKNSNDRKSKSMKASNKSRKSEKTKTNLTSKHEKFSKKESLSTESPKKFPARETTSQAVPGNANQDVQQRGNKEHSSKSRNKRSNKSKKKSLQENRHPADECSMDTDGGTASVADVDMRILSENSTKINQNRNDCENMQDEPDSKKQKIEMQLDMRDVMQQDYDYRRHGSGPNNPSGNGWAQYKAAHPDEFKSPLRPAKENMISPKDEDFRHGPGRMSGRPMFNNRFRAGFDRFGRPLLRRLMSDPRFRFHVGFGKNDMQYQLESMLANPEAYLQQTEEQMRAGRIDPELHRELKSDLEKLTQLRRGQPLNFRNAGGWRFPPPHHRMDDRRQFGHQKPVGGDSFRMFPDMPLKQDLPPPSEPAPPIGAIRVDTKMRQVQYIEDMAVLILDGNDTRQIMFKGIPKRIFIDDLEPLILGFNGEIKEFEINGKRHVVKFGAPLRELYIDNVPYSAQFGGAPLVVNLDGGLHVFRLEPPPPTVDIEQKPPPEIIEKLGRILSEKDKAGDEKLINNEKVMDGAQDVDMRHAGQTSGQVHSSGTPAGASISDGFGDMKDVDLRQQGPPPSNTMGSPYRFEEEAPTRSIAAQHINEQSRGRNNSPVPPQVFEESSNSPWGSPSRTERKHWSHSGHARKEDGFQNRSNTESGEWVRYSVDGEPQVYQSWNQGSHKPEDIGPPHGSYGSVRPSEIIPPMQHVSENVPTSMAQDRMMRPEINRMAPVPQMMEDPQQINHFNDRKIRPPWHPDRGNFRNDYSQQRGGARRRGRGSPHHLPEYPSYFREGFQRPPMHQGPPPIGMEQRAPRPMMPMHPPNFQQGPPQQGPPPHMSVPQPQLPAPMQMPPQQPFRPARWNSEPVQGPRPMNYQYHPPPPLQQRFPQPRPEHLPGLYPQQPIQHPPQTEFSQQVPPPPEFNITDLFNKLVTAGIIKAPEAKTEPVETKSEEDQKKEMESIPPLSFTSEVLKTKHPGIISALHIGTQCASCGMRFTDNQGLKYRQHLDWHFRSNRREKDGVKKAFSRKWFYDVEDWIQFEEIEDLEERARSFFELQANIEQDQVPSPAEVKSVLASSEETENVCAVCGEAFQLFWVEEEEEWHLKDAIRVEDKTYHPSCYEDFKKASETPSSPKEDESMEVLAEEVSVKQEPEDEDEKTDKEAEVKPETESQEANSEATNLDEATPEVPSETDDTKRTNDDESLIKDKLVEEVPEDPVVVVDNLGEFGVGSEGENDSMQVGELPEPEPKVVVKGSGGIVLKVKAESIQAPSSPSAPASSSQDKKTEETEDEEEFRPPTPDPNYKNLPPVQKGKELSGLCCIM